jgi:hypothetical protein
MCFRAFGAWLQPLDTSRVPYPGHPANLSGDSAPPAKGGFFPYSFLVTPLLGFAH